MLNNLDLNDFWSDDAGSDAFMQETLTDQTIRTVEAALGYRLPASYVSLMKRRNGGIPKRCFVKGSYSVIEGIYGIGPKSVELYKAATDAWGYPAIGVPICDGPSGHTMFFLDYRNCGRDGEPKVAEIDQECDDQITVLADSFAEFVGNLVYEEENDSDEQIAENQRRLADPYRDVELRSVDPDLRREFRRAVWGEWTWSLVIGWGVVLLAGVVFLQGSSAGDGKLRKLSIFLMGWLILHAVVSLAVAFDCCKKTKKPCRYYFDRVERCWEENGKRYYCLEKSKKEKYSNNIDAKPGDAVTVFVLEKGEIVTGKSQKTE